VGNHVVEVWNVEQTSVQNVFEDNVLKEDVDQFVIIIQIVLDKEIVHNVTEDLMEDSVSVLHHVKVLVPSMQIVMEH